MILVPRQEGVETKQMTTRYSKAAGTAYVTFDNVRVPVENTLGQEDMGIVRFSSFSSRFPFPNPFIELIADGRAWLLNFSTSSCRISTVCGFFFPFFDSSGTLTFCISSLGLDERWVMVCSSTRSSRMAVEEVRTPSLHALSSISESRLTSRIFRTVLRLGLSEEGQHFPLIDIDLLRTD